MCKAQSILNLLLGGLTTEKTLQEFFQVTNTGKYFPRTMASPLNNHKLLKTEQAKRLLSYVPGKLRGRLKLSKPAP